MLDFISLCLPVRPFSFFFGSQINFAWLTEIYHSFLPVFPQICPTVEGCVMYQCLNLVHRGYRCWNLKHKSFLSTGPPTSNNRPSVHILASGSSCCYCVLNFLRDNQTSVSDCVQLRNKVKAVSWNQWGFKRSNNELSVHTLAGGSSCCYCLANYVSWWARI